MRKLINNETISCRADSSKVNVRIEYEEMGVYNISNFYLPKAASNTDRFIYTIAVFRNLISQKDRENVFTTHDPENAFFNFIVNKYGDAARKVK